MIKQYFAPRSKTAAAGLAVVLALGGFGIARASRLENANPPANVKLADANEGPSRTGFAPVVKKVLPTVVNISSSKVVKTPTGFDGQFPDDPLFRQFFGNQFGRGFSVAREQREHGLGSGVIVSPNGYILTNNHVVDGATNILVTLSDKREFKGRVIGTDPKTDIAVLKIDASDLPSIVVGDSSKVQIGDYALAVGDPFGVGQTVTMGIVSATGRANLGIEAYEDFIQTDAPINPGNSGGALVNDRGELIGINTAIIAHGSEGNQGIGFAIPANLARTVMDEIIRNGKVTRAYLGIVPQDVTPVMAKAFSEAEPQGALIGDVANGSPAQKAGLQKGDIILEVNGKPIADSNQLRMMISMMAPDSAANLKVLRNGSTKEVAVKLGVLPTEQEQANSGQANPQGSLEGVSVENMTPQSARELGVPSTTTGVVVAGIKPSSKAADAGLQQGDVIQEVNHHPVKDVSDFDRELSKAGSGPVLLLVNRQGNTMFVA